MSKCFVYIRHSQLLFDWNYSWRLLLFFRELLFPLIYQVLILRTIVELFMLYLYVLEQWPLRAITAIASSDWTIEIPFDLVSSSSLSFRFLAWTIILQLLFLFLKVLSSRYTFCTLNLFGLLHMPTVYQELHSICAIWGTADSKSELITVWSFFRDFLIEGSFLYERYL